ncbi:MAG TPA: ATP-binding protein [Candidatus Sulfomarinibacteraceae bacterium]|nr:ATP-binding protein [Candidatus Sulfomarinibacteraceae bacterium]
MKTDIHVFRRLSRRLPGVEDRRRLVVITGARQTGKTTLARNVYPDLRYLNLDAIELRAMMREVRTSRWGEEVGPAVLDEAQKEPGVFDKVKYAFDEGSLDFTVLLGSSRILLLDQVRESLAGRAFVYDLWPLMVSELAGFGVEEPAPPLLDTLLRDLGGARRLLAGLPETSFDERGEAARAAVEHLAAWGGMPALLPLEDDERREWLAAYQQTYLERDLADLATLSDLLPFRNLQRLAMLRTGCLVNYAELARDAGMSPTTARRYLEYLRMTYQAVLLPPYLGNLTSRIVKSPKLYWTDLGLLRHATRQWGPIDGTLFETLVVSEIVKWVSTAALPVDLFFYRTRSGFEVDLLIEGDGAVFGLEVKRRDRVDGRDLGPLRKVSAALGDRWAGGAVVSTGNRLECLDESAGIWAVPVHRLLG